MLNLFIISRSCVITVICLLFCARVGSFFSIFQNRPSFFSESVFGFSGFGHMVTEIRFERCNIILMFSCSSFVYRYSQLQRIFEAQVVFFQFSATETFSPSPSEFSMNKWLNNQLHIAIP